MYDVCNALYDNNNGDEYQEKASWFQSGKPQWDEMKRIPHKIPHISMRKLRGLISQVSEIE